ncbi:hypothetical protein J3R83DRAFT_4098 [Lanmaoa asiatica]|nr:hypothetical protein J3R83DRAFT_4098 [Lanmaoa asiatica]
MELNTLNHKHGIKGLIVVVQGSHNIKMDPRIHMTSEVVSHFLRTTTSSDPMVFGMKMEVAALATRNAPSMSFDCRPDLL